MNDDEIEILMEILLCGGEVRSSAFDDMVDGKKTWLCVKGYVLRGGGRVVVTDEGRRALERLA